MRAGTPLLHPFDDALFAILARRRGIERSDLPCTYDPGHEWGNDGITTDLPGMPGFAFIAGDDSYHGSLRIDIDPMEDVIYESDAGGARIGIGMKLPETVKAHMVGKALGRVVEGLDIPERLITAVVEDDETTWLRIQDA